MPRKNKGIYIRSDDEQPVQQFKEFVSQNKHPNYADALKYLLANVGSEIFLEYLDCDHFGEYPDNSKHFIRCNKSGTKVERTREDCQECGHHKKVRVLMQSIEKIKQETVKAEHKHANLITEINEKMKQLKNIENLTSMPELLKERDKEIAKLQKDKKAFERDQYSDYSKSFMEPIEADNTFHSVEDTVKHKEPCGKHHSKFLRRQLKPSVLLRESRRRKR